MKKADKRTLHVVIFVEGDTDKVFFDHLVRYYREVSKEEIRSCEVYNLKGVSRYVSKFLQKLKNELLPEARRRNREIIAVGCSYDTDVFEQNIVPVVDWKAAEKGVHKLGISTFCEIQVKSAMEDWLLDDMAGLCRYLKLKDVPTSLKGRNGFEKMDNLFKKGNRRYSKGFQIDAFIHELDMGVIRQKRLEALKGLEDALGVKIEDCFSTKVSGTLVEKTGA